MQLSSPLPPPNLRPGLRLEVTTWDGRFTPLARLRLEVMLIIHKIRITADPKILSASGNRGEKLGDHLCSGVVYAESRVQSVLPEVLVNGVVAVVEFSVPLDKKVSK